MITAHGLRAASGVLDPNFNQTVLLLHGDGTNGAQNNTFLDSSTNNYTVTRNGNTTQGTFSPFSADPGEWSNHFDGTGDYLTIADSANLELPTQDFTIELWVYLNATLGSGVLNTLVQKGLLVGGTLEYGLGIRNNSGTLQIEFRVTTNGSTITTYIGTGAGVETNKWNHIAVTRTGATLEIYLNGVDVGGSATFPTTIYTGAGNLGIGATAGGSDPLNQYISNVRIVKGTVVYTGNFTPPKIPLTAIANTQLLTCQNNRIIDNSSNNFTLTRNGDVTVRPFSPFAPSGVYNSVLNGGSAYFDGTGDYLSVADAAALRAGTSNFTIQAWIYRTASGVQHSIAAKGTSTTGWAFLVVNTDVLRFVYTTSSVSSTGTIPAGVWTHVAVVREGTGTNQLKLYINGVQDGQGTVSTNFNQTNQLNIGADRSATATAACLISSFRFVVGTAETITVPTAPLTDVTNTQLLLNFTNAGIIDNTAKNVLETVGNAQLDTTTKKFGTASLDFDGTGDWCLLPDNIDLRLGTGNFTIEFWVYLASGDTGSTRGLVGKGTATTGWLVSLNTTEKVVFTDTTSTITSSGSITTNAWNHVAVVREGTGSNQTKIYIAGSNDGTGTVSTDFNQTNLMYIGANRTGGNPMKGFIDDLRITKGIARYTTTFPVPKSPFQNR